ncbi:MAG: hypothetical protein M3T55_11110 [Pseudomonadota bacterium]|nr:hypothetical protein [Pseudomonadota bacterium]
MDELLSVDPYADKTAKIYFGIEETPGVPAKEMHYLGEDKRFSAKWANKAHNALGYFLHEPTISQHEKGLDKSEEAARIKAAEVLIELEGILSATLFNVNFGTFMTVECECGFQIKRKMTFLKEGNLVACASCGRQYTYELSDADKTCKFQFMQIPYKCFSCGKEAFIDAHAIEDLPVVVCTYCEAKAKIDVAYQIHPLNEAVGALLEE